MPGLSVIVVGAGEESRHVRNLAEIWTANGLLQDSVWVTPDDVVEQPSGPPIVSASIVTPAGVHTDDLFRLVGVRRIDLLRLVAVEMIDLSETPRAVIVSEAVRLASRYGSDRSAPSTSGSPRSPLRGDVTERGIRPIRRP